jgi:hypothetical protein
MLMTEQQHKLAPPARQIKPGSTAAQRQRAHPLALDAGNALASRGAAGKHRGAEDKGAAAWITELEQRSQGDEFIAALAATSPAGRA